MRRFSNLTSTPGITIQSKRIVVPSSHKQILCFNVTINNLSSINNLGRIITKYYIDSDESQFNMKLYKATSDIYTVINENNALLLLSGMDSNLLFNTTINKKSGKEYEKIRLDCLPNLIESNSFCFFIVADCNESLSYELNIDSINTDEVIIGEVINEANESYLHEKMSLNLGLVSNLSIDLFDCSAEFNLFNISTDNSFPISISVLYKKGQVGLLGQNLKFDFEYKIRICDDHLELIGPNNDSTFYSAMDRAEALEKYHIDASQYSGDLFVNILDYSFIVKDLLIKFYLVKKDGTVIYFRSSNYVLNTILNIQILSITTSNGVINYNWTSNDILKLIYNSKGKIQLIYNSNGLISRINYDKNRFCLFEYVLINNENYLSKIKYCDNNNPTEEEIINDTVCLQYDNALLCNYFYDDLTKQGIKLEYSSSGLLSKVSTILYGTSEYLGYYLVEKNSDYTKISNHLGDSTYYYFDDNDNCYFFIDNDGNYKTKVYQSDNDIGVRPLLVSESNWIHQDDNLLENSNFINYSDIIFGWSKEDNNSWHCKKVLGVAGASAVCFYGDTSGKISQSILHLERINQSKLELNGYVKGTGCVTLHAKINNETISRSFTCDNNWQEVSLIFDIPSNLSSLKVEISFDSLDTICLSNFYLGFDKKENNLLLNSHMDGFYYDTYLRGWDYNDAFIDGASQRSVTIQEPFNKIIKKELVIDGCTNETRNLWQEVDVTGGEGEVLSFSFFAKTNYINNDFSYSFIKIKYLGETEEVEYRQLFGDSANEYKVVRQVVTTKTAYTKVTIGIVFASSNQGCISAFSLVKTKNDNYYHYNEYNNLQDIIGNANTNINYDNKSHIKRIINAIGEVFEYQYDSNGKLNSISDANGNTYSFEYDANGYLSKNIITTRMGRRISKEIANDLLGNPIYINDFDKRCVAYEYDDRERLIKKSNSGGLVEHFAYNNKDLLTNKTYDLNESLVINAFSYDNKDNISSVGINNEFAYNFGEYDNWNNIKQLKLDNNLLNSYTYLINENNYTGLPLTKTYPNGIYNFSYDNKQRLSNVSFNNTEVSTYNYNDSNQLKRIVDASSETFIKYDLDGNVKSRKIISGNNEFTTNYEYDNLGSVQQKTFKINNDILNYNYDYLYEHSEYSQGGYFSRLENVFLNDIIFEEKKLKYGSEITTTLSLPFDQKLRRNLFRFNTNSDYLPIDINQINSRRKNVIGINESFNYEEWKLKQKNQKSVFFWLRINHINNTLNNVKILSFSNELGEVLSLTYCSDGYLSVNYGNSTFDIFSVKADDWNLIGIELERIEENNNISTRISQFVNRYKHNNTVTDDFVESITNIQFGNNEQISSDLSATFDILYISLGNSSISQDGYRGIYNDGIKYVFSETPLKSKGVMYYNKHTYSGLDVVPLNGCLSSIKGLKPIEYTFTDTSYKLNKTKLFKLDNKLSNIDNEFTNRHIYGSFNEEVGLDGKTKSVLSYDLGIRNKGTISFKFKINQETDINRLNSRTLLSIDSDDTLTKKLIVEISNWNQTICLYTPSCNISGGTRLDTHLTVLPNVWHWFTVAWCETGIKIQLDNVVRTFDFSSELDISDCKTYFGCNIVGGIPMYQLNGIIEMISYKDDYLENIHNSLISNGSVISRIKLFDDLDRPIREELITNSAKFNHLYHYNDEYDETDALYDASFYPSIEELEDGTQIIYAYDGNGNIINKVSSKNGTILETLKYKYDISSRLIDELCYNGTIFNYHYKYDYNDIGDITKKTSINQNGVDISKDIYNYSLSIKSELLSINHYLVINGQDVLSHIDNITYSVNDPFRPSSYKGSNLTWQGRRLTSFGNNTYTYNHEGIRISKVTYNGTYQYIIDGTKIIKETNPVYGDVFYHYDEEGMLVGFHYNDDEYFYVRDLTGNIIKVIDESGIIKVKYRYDAWGRVLSITGDDILKNVNSFLYKGYYYDFETQLFYCNSRYYSPELCRFISPDSIEYLDPQSINGLNLYAYCMNNPIMYADPSGHSPTAWWEWALAGVAVAGLIVGSIFTCGTLAGAVLAGAAIGAGISLGTQAFSGELNWGQFALDTGVGAITGLIGGSGVSRGVATLLGGVVGAGSNFVSQLITGTELEDISVMQILAAGAIGALSGFIGGAGARNKAAINQGKGVQAATKQLNKVVRRIANGYRYNATTAQVAFTNAMNGLTNAISSQMGRMLATTMIFYGVSTVVFAGIDAGFDYLGWWFF